jgi:hypothetical protein
MSKQEYKEIDFTLPKAPSLNQFYAGRHYSVRQKYKKEYNAEIKNVFDQYDKFFADTYKIDLVHNTRYDCDNVIITIKFISDYLKDNGYVTDDSKKYFKSLSIRVAEDGEVIEKNSISVKIKLYGYQELPEL